MKKLVYVFLCILVFTNVKIVSAQDSDTLNPVADVYIVTFGGGEGKNSFMKFDISSIPASSVITSVKLRIFVTDTAAQWDGDAEYTRVDKQSWLESHHFDTLWNPLNFTDTLIQPMGFATVPGWTESIDIKSLFNYDYSIGNTYFTLKVKDNDDWTMAPGFYPTMDSNDSLMLGNIFNDYIVFAPHETSIPGAQPQLIVDYTLVTDIEEHDSNIDLFPNPASDNLTIEYKLESPTNGEIIIYSLDGTIVLRNELATTSNKLNIDISDLANGTYFYTILTQYKSIKNGKIVVMR